MWEEVVTSCYVAAHMEVETQRRFAAVSEVLVGLERWRELFAAQYTMRRQAQAVHNTLTLLLAFNLFFFIRYRSKYIGRSGIGFPVRNIARLAWWEWAEDNCWALIPLSARQAQS